MLLEFGVWHRAPSESRHALSWWLYGGIKEALCSEGSVISSLWSSFVFQHQYVESKCVCLNVFGRIFHAVGMHFLLFLYPLRKNKIQSTWEGAEQYPVTCVASWDNQGRQGWWRMEGEWTESSSHLFIEKEWNRGTAKFTVFLNFVCCKTNVWRLFL